MRIRKFLPAALFVAMFARAPAGQAATWDYRIGEEAPSFSLKALDGQALSSADLKGQFTVISFMTTWCPYCNAAAPHVQKLQEDYRARGVRVVIVDIDEKHKPVQKFVKKHGLTCPILMDADGTVATRFAPPEDFIPDLERHEIMIASFVIVGPDGRIRALTLNEKPEEFDARLTGLRGRLDELLAAKPPAARQ